MLVSLLHICAHYFNRVMTFLCAFAAKGVLPKARMALYVSQPTRDEGHTFSPGPRSRRYRGRALGSVYSSKPPVAFGGLERHYCVRLKNTGRISTGETEMDYQLAFLNPLMASTGTELRQLSLAAIPRSVLEGRLLG